MYAVVSAASIYRWVRGCKWEVSWRRRGGGDVWRSGAGDELLLSRKMAVAGSPPKNYKPTLASVTLAQLFTIDIHMPSLTCQVSSASASTHVTAKEILRANETSSLGDGCRPCSSFYLIRQLWQLTSQTIQLVLFPRQPLNLSGRNTSMLSPRPFSTDKPFARLLKVLALHNFDLTNNLPCRYSTQAGSPGQSHVRTAGTCQYCSQPPEYGLAHTTSTIIAWVWVSDSSGFGCL